MRGLDCILYYDVDGAGQGNWTELKQVDDVAENDQKESADMSSRAGGGVKEEEDTIVGYEITFNLIWKSGDAGCEAIYNANKNRSVIGIAAMDGDIAVEGQRGLQADCKIFGFNRTQPLRDGVKVAVTVRPCVSDFAHGWKEIAGS